ncbi:Nucleolar complex protein 3-like protein [Armadillidium nasatum]|uniref:NOC3-like protein n=1 Tax=Armadillidium nasatum TaxID=96803 RepID=A0A5N5SZV3_9CRUS|nr:Nucleolar complex protein 3-like protein [Armadillidium nasatum]
MGKPKKRKNKKSLSSVKKKNITRNKLNKQGVIKKQKNKEQKKEKRREKRREETRHMQMMQKKEEMSKEEELTGEDMMEMMDEDDLNTLLKANESKRIKDIEGVESQGREFKQYVLKTKDGKLVKERLPIMTEEGWKERLVVPSAANQDSLGVDLILNKYKRTHIGKKTSSKEDEDSGIGEAELSEDEEKSGDETPSGGVKSVAQILAERKRYLHEQKVKMACLALNVVQDSSKLVNLKFLLNMLTSNDPKGDVTIYKYTLQTILQVFHDLIPGYRIQENALQNSKMQKEKFISAKQEKIFIEYYKNYLKSLEDVLLSWKQEPDNLGLTAVSETVIYCLGDLLVRHPAFNYNVNIVQALVPYLTHKHDKVRKLALDSLGYAIRNDKHYFITLEIVRYVYKLAHRLRFKVKEDVFRVLLCLRGSEMKNSDEIIEQQRSTTNAITHKEKLIKKLTEKFSQKPSKKQRKEKKKMAKLNKQMESINVAEMQNIQNTHHSEIIEKVFGLYINVLKNRPYSKLMSLVLEGLAKFAHLVNMEFFSDLLELMNKFLEEGMLGKRESIHCIQTVFTILSGQGEALNVDPHRFYNQFFRILIELNAREREENIEAILDILEQMLVLRRRRVSSPNVLSFIKRIATISLLLPHHLAIPTLLKLKKLFSLFPVSEALLESDQEGFPGVFLPDIPDPEHSNSGATAIWELILAQRSFQPYVALLANNILSSVPIREVPALRSIIEKPTRRLIEEFGPSKLKFNPDIPKPSSHLKSVKRKAPKQLFQKWRVRLRRLEATRNM